MISKAAEEDIQAKLTVWSSIGFHDLKASTKFHQVIWSSMTTHDIITWFNKFPCNSMVFPHPWLIVSIGPDFNMAPYFCLWRQISSQNNWVIFAICFIYPLAVTKVAFWQVAIHKAHPSHHIAEIDQMYWFDNIL